MPGGSRYQQGNEILDQVLYLPSVTYPTLAANTSGTNTISVVGALPLDLLSWNMQAPPAHVFLENMYVSAAGVVTASWTTDSTGISTGSVALVLSICRAENANLGTSALPQALV